MPESLMRVLLMTMTVAAGVGSSVQAQQSGTPADEPAARQPADTLRKLAEALGVEPHELMKED